MKVLIADDSDLLQSRLKNALLKTDKKLSISQARNCKEARELFSSFRPDTIILDIAFPDGSGIDLLRKFKKENPSTKVIMFTNYPTEEFKKSCMDLGANSFLDKSNISRLINSIK